MLKRIATAVVLIPVVLLLVLRAPVPVVALVTVAIALITVQEFLKLTESYGVQPLRLPTYIFVGLFFLLLAASTAGDAPQPSALKFLLETAFACALAPFVFLTIAMRRAQMSGSYPAAAAASFAFVYIALPMGMLVQLRQQWAGAFWLLYLLLIVWAGDIFAYFVGRSLGRHLMAPRISPKKTWEGLAGSALLTVVAGAILLPTLLHGHWWQGVITGIAAVAAAVFGDLAESMIKRDLDVKDMGSLLPGHGGILDRIDSLLACAPVVWLLLALFVK